MANPESRPWSKVESAVTPCCKGGPRTGLRYLRIDAKRVVCLRWHSQEHGDKASAEDKQRLNGNALCCSSLRVLEGDGRSQLKMSMAIS